MATQPRSNDALSRIPLLEDDAAPLPGVEGLALPLPAPESSSEVKLNPDGSADFVQDAEGALGQIEELEDGSAIVYDDVPTLPESSGEFLENLAEILDDTEKGRIARLILDAVERDKEDRKDRDVLYAEGLKRTGLGKEAPGGAGFEGASQAVHPMLVEGCVDFAARTMKEIFPPSGPVKTHIVGKSDRSKLERAERKRKYMNWQCTRQIRELRPMVEEMLTQIPLGGSQYLKVWYDDRVARPRAEFVPVDKMLIPYAASSLDSAERKTHWQDITADEFMSRVESGLYYDYELSKGSADRPDKTDSEKANDKIEGRSDMAYNEDGLRTVYETYIKLQVEGDDLVPEGRMAPYIATVDLSTGLLLALYRNWKPDDEKLEELDWIVEGKFVVWRGAYGLGLIHLAGGLSAAATGSLRALLDAALINNFPGGLKLKGARMAGQTVKGQPTELVEIEGPTAIDDIRKIVMPYPFNGPSTVLYELLKYVVDAGKGVINTAEERIAEASNNAPVGTTLALIEQGSVTYSSIHSRMHAMMARLLSILHRIDAEFLEDEETVEELGELVVSRADFEGPMDVIPVSDPNIFSESQRYAQLQAVLQLRQTFAPGSFKDNALLEQALRLLNYPGYEDIINTPLEAVERDAVEENAVASDPQAQIQAYETQDHFAHLETHIRFMSSPILCANPIMAPVTLPKLMEHCKQHLIELYRENMRAAIAAVEPNAAEFETITNADQVAATAAGLVDKEIAEKIGPIMNVLQQLSQQMAQLIPPPPSPEVGVAQVKAQADLQREQVRQQGDAQREQARLAAQAQSAAQAAQAAGAATSAKIQADATKHTEEMALARENAQVAEASERRKQDMDMLREEMRLARQADMEALRTQNAQVLERIRGENAQVVALINKLLDDKAAAVEDPSNVAAAKSSSGASVGG